MGNSSIILLPTQKCHNKNIINVNKDLIEVSLATFSMVNGPGAGGLWYLKGRTSTMALSPARKNCLTVFSKMELQFWGEKRGTE